MRRGAVAALAGLASLAAAPVPVPASVDLSSLAGDAAVPLAPPAASTAPAPPAREGLASWYGGSFHGRMTACGETFDEGSFTVAHRTLAFGTLLSVTNLDTGCRVMVRVNDRGPYHGDRIMDCSRVVAEELGFLEDGVARIRWDIIDPAAVAGPPARAANPSRPAARPLARRESGAPALEPPRPMNTEEASW